MPKGNVLMMHLTANYYSSVLLILKGLRACVRACVCVNGQNFHGQELIFQFFFV